MMADCDSMVSHQMWGMSWDQHSRYGMISTTFESTMALGSAWNRTVEPGGAGLWDRECFGGDAPG